MLKGYISILSTDTKDRLQSILDEKLSRANAIKEKALLGGFGLLAVPDDSRISAQNIVQERIEQMKHMKFMIEGTTIKVTCLTREMK